MDLTFQHFKMMEAIAAAVYLIEEIKAFDPRCGGPTRVAWITIEQRPDKKQIVAEELRLDAMREIFDEV